MQKNIIKSIMMFSLLPLFACTNYLNIPAISDTSGNAPGGDSNSTNTTDTSSTSNALITISDTPEYDFGNKGYNRTAEHTFTITKTGDKTASFISANISAPFAFKGGSYPGTGGTCGIVLNNGCTIVATFIPTETQSSSSSLTINYSNGTEATNTSVGMKGYGFNPLSSGNTHSCFILDGGTLKCWGDNWAGQLGYGDAVSRGGNLNDMGSNLSTVNLGLGRTAIGIGAGDTSTCALLDDHTVKCWGNNSYGELGLGVADATVQDPSGPIDLGTNRTAKRIFGGLTSYSHCAILDTDELKCWGYNQYGQLGYGDLTDRGTTPASMGNGLPAINVGVGRTVKNVSMNGGSTCAILDDDSVKCWGLNTRGQLGLGVNDAERHSATTAIDLGSTIKMLPIGGGWHVCAILIDNNLKCWGSSDEYEGGYGDTTARGDAATPDLVSLATVNLGASRTAKFISTGDTDVCVIMDDNNVKCWGEGSSGELGYGDGLDKTTVPATTLNLGVGRTAVTVTNSATFSCAYLDDGNVKCWGSNANGELGQEDTATRNSSNVTAIAF